MLASFFGVSSLNYFSILGEYHFFAHQLEVLFLTLLSFFLCPQNAHKAKAVLSSLFVYCLYIISTDWFMFPTSLFQYLFEILFFLLVTLFQIVKRYDKSSSFPNGNILILFYRPKTLFECITTLFGLNASSMSISHGDNWYLFRRKCDTLQKEKFNAKVVNDRYTVLDTGIALSQTTLDKLNALVGRKARTAGSLYFRFNCVIIFREFLKDLGYRWEVKGLDIIPSIYLIRRI